MSEQRARARNRAEEGIGLVQVFMAALLLAIAALSLSAVQVQSLALNRTNKETEEARQAARQILEQIQQVDPGDVFASFNATPGDDPAGPGTAPGNLFTVTTDAGDMQCEVLFPGGSALREDVVDPLLGMPRDLNGDSAIDNLNHATDYLLLPVRIRVSWNGVSGARDVDLHVLLCSQ
jgi:hypothetical protein